MKRLGIFADFHCGHKSGLTPPDFWGGGRKIVDKMAERWTWFVQSIKEHGPFDAAVHNGDLVDGPGVKSGNETIMNLNQQTDAAAEIIRTIGAKENFLLFGTPIHAITGDGYELERDVAKSVGCPIHGQIWLNVEGWILDIRHHPAGNSQVYPATPLQKEWESNIRWSREGVQEEADIIMRAHVHKSFQTGKPDVWQAIAIPALQDFGGIYGRRLSNTVDFGWGTLDVMDKKKRGVARMENQNGTEKKGSSFEIIASTEPAMCIGDGFGAGHKACKQCGMIQPYSAYRVDAKGIGGRKAICKACSNERTIKSPPKKGTISNDRIQKALEAAAYRIIKEAM